MDGQEVDQVRSEILQKQMANIRGIHTMGYIGITKDSLDNLSPP